MTSLFATAGGIGAGMFVAALIMMKKHYGAKLIPWLMLIAGGTMTGAVGSMLDRAAAAGARGVNSASARLLGAGIPFLLTLAVFLFLLPHMKLKSAQPPTKATPWLALVFFPLLAATGFGALIALLGSLGTQVGPSVSATLTAFIGGS